MEAHISISIQEGKIDISGPEEFVRKQIDNFKDLIQKLLTLPPGGGTGGPLGGTGGSRTDIPTGWEKVIAFEGDGIKILKDPPGKNKGEKTISLAQIYLHAKGMKGKDTATSQEVRKACKEHACLDSPNFASKIKEKKDIFIVSGSGKRDQTIKLTVPGKAKAAALVAELNGQ